MRKLIKTLNTISVSLIICFITKTIIDYCNYSTVLNSAPFRIWIYVNVIYFIVPAVIVKIIECYIKRRNKK